MSRTRRRSSNGGRWDLLARPQWWVGVTLSVASWIALHAMSADGVKPASREAAVDAGTAIVQTAQWALPLLCLAAAWVFAGHGRRRAPDAALATGGDALASADWASASQEEFEALVARSFAQQGYQVTAAVQSGARPGDGVALVLRKDRQTHLVRCHDWRSARVPVDAVQALHKAMTARGAEGGFALARGRFTREAHAYASSCNVRLIEGPALAALVRRALAGH